MVIMTPSDRASFTTANEAKCDTQRNNISTREMLVSHVVNDDDKLRIFTFIYEGFCRYEQRRKNNVAQETRRENHFWFNVGMFHRAS